MTYGLAHPPPPTCPHTHTQTKTVYDTLAEQPDGSEDYFRRPWMMTLVMFVGMSFCLPLAYASEARAKRQAQKQRAAEAGVEQRLLGEYEVRAGGWV